MVAMILWSPPVNQYIVYKYHHKLVQVGFKDSIHKVHECCRGISKPKGHHYELIMPVPSAEGSLR